MLIVNGSGASSIKNGYIGAYWLNRVDFNINVLKPIHELLKSNFGNF